jgi:hypothetical protein
MVGRDPDMGRSSLDHAKKLIRARDDSGNLLPLIVLGARERVEVPEQLVRAVDQKHFDARA